MTSATHPHRREHLTPEELAAYVDHGLSLSERNRAEQHLATCGECMQLLAGAVRTVAELVQHLPDPELPPPLVSRRAVAGAVLAAAVMALVLLGGRCGV